MQYRFDAFGTLQTKTLQEIEEMETDADFVIVLAQGISSDDKPYWAYIAIRPSRYADYMRAAKAHALIVFADYGTILQYGFDKEVPGYVKDKMKRRYGFDENYRENLIRDINQARETFLKKRNSGINDIVDMMKNRDTKPV